MLPNKFQLPRIGMLQTFLESRQNRRVRHSTCLDDMLSRHICPSSTVSKPLRLLPPPKSFHHTPPYSLKQIRLSQPCFRLPPQTPDRQRTTIARRNGSSLALHSEPLFQPSSDPDPDTPPEISDNEWEIRTGQLYVNLNCLPVIQVRVRSGNICPAGDTSRVLRYRPYHFSGRGVRCS